MYLPALIAYTSARRLLLLEGRSHLSGLSILPQLFHVGQGKADAAALLVAYVELVV